MKDEYISLSIIGAVGLIAGGICLGTMAVNGVDVPHVILVVMLALVLRADARDPTVSGEYKRGWFVWRRIGPCKINPEASE